MLKTPDHFHAFGALCAFAGLRLGEAADVQLGDLDFLRRTLSIQRQIQGPGQLQGGRGLAEVRVGPDGLPTAATS